MSMDENTSLETLRDVLVNASGKTPLADRFRALFYLKSIGTEFKETPERARTAIKYIAEAFVSFKIRCKFSTLSVDLSSGRGGAGSTDS